jgi:ABC-type nitrate/sulfonate/bicarbonate transport system substrate-binding protein
MKDRVQITGVPEHFNLPWHMALEEGAFADRGIELVWTDTPEGTGRMIQKLDSGEADLAVILTEGVVKAIGEGLKAAIVQQYVGSPLLWGIHVAAQSPYKELEELESGKAAISRLGSGSHLMAVVNARQQEWPLHEFRYEIVHTLEGAVKALTDGTADYFMWERFTTQPLVDKGVFRRLGVCPTPWPCFVIAARWDFLQTNGSVLESILDVINTYTREFRNIPSIDRTLANRYGQELPAVQEWLSLTRWSQNQIERQDIEKVINTLSDLNLLSNQISPDQVLI